MRLHVAVHEAAAVRERQSARDLDRELEGSCHRQRLALLDQPLEVLAADVLEDDELVAVVLASIDHRHDVRMREDGGRPGLPPEALDVLGIVQVVLVEHLERDGAVEESVVRAIDARHAAGADELLELVPV